MDKQDFEASKPIFISIIIAGVEEKEKLQVPMHNIDLNMKQDFCAILQCRLFIHLGLKTRELTLSVPPMSTEK